MPAPPHKKQRRHGDYSTTDDSFGVQSLPVAILPPDFSGDPSDGETYLAVVRREAAAAPGVFFASNNPYAPPSTSSPPPPPPPITAASTHDGLLMPSSSWRDAFTLQFKNARESLSNPPTEPVKLTKDDLPKISNSPAWYAWIHGRPPPPSSPEEATRQASKHYGWRLKEPIPALLLRLNTEQILGLLEGWPYWIAHRVTIPDSQTTKEDREGEQGEPVLQPLHARWLFGLLLRLDGRLVSEEISVLRTLARACVAAITLGRIRRKALRSRANHSMEGSREEKDGENEQGETGMEKEKEEARMRRDEAGAWMVVAIVAGVWGQSDLWDDAVVDMRRVT